MWKYFSKFLSGFSYGAGFLLAIVCAFYALNQYSQGSTRIVSSESGSETSPNAQLSAVEIKNVSKLSNFTNYSNEGMKEEFIFTGELQNLSDDTDFNKLMVEVDLYDSDGKFIFKCGGWDGVGISVEAKSITNFQKHCFQMPSTIVERYESHKVSIRQRNF